MPKLIESGTIEVKVDFVTPVGEQPDGGRIYRLPLAYLAIVTDMQRAGMGVKCHSEIREPTFGELPRMWIDDPQKHPARRRVVEVLCDITNNSESEQIAALESLLRSLQRAHFQSTRI